MAPVSAVFIMSCKERVLAVQGDGSDAAFHDIAVHLDGAVGEKTFSHPAPDVLK